MNVGVETGSGMWSDVLAGLARGVPADWTEDARKRYERGARQVSQLWTEEDGSAEDLQAFIKSHFILDPQLLDQTFDRFQFVLENLLGHFLEMRRALSWHTDLDLGDLLPVDPLLAAYSPSAHLNDDLFRSKLGFVILLNFPVTTLEERVNEGKAWTRRQWAEARLAQLLTQRIPARVRQEVAKVTSGADSYIASYNIWTHHVLTADGERLFPAGQRLIAHWNLRDEIKALYGAPDSARAHRQQKLIQLVMEHIVRQTIPQVVIDNPHVDWSPETGRVTQTTALEANAPSAPAWEVSSEREPDTRYRWWLSTFHAARLEDPYSPSMPSLIARRFEGDRELSEERVQGMLEEVLSSPLLKSVAELIQARLKRPLEPYDIWFNGFRAQGQHSEAVLDDMVRSRYPNLASFREQMPRILQKLGFSAEQAHFLSDRIDVDPARGAGHASGAGRRGDKARLRTRVPRGGMDYKGFNIAMHELGHNVEQTYSLYEVDHYTLNGVPNTAFTEALAFVFQGRDLEVLGLEHHSEEGRAWAHIHDYWATAEIAGVGLVDMQVWRWMYAHPEATPAQMRTAVIEIACDVWNRFYGPVIGIFDVPLLAIYSHMIDSFMYTPDYPLGHLIAHQLEVHLLKSPTPAEEIRRMMRLGALSPDVWMVQATGEEVGARPLLRSAAGAIEWLKSQKLA